MLKCSESYATYGEIKVVLSRQIRHTPEVDPGTDVPEPEKL
jgi:hypothetical protein